MSRSRTLVIVGALALFACSGPFFVFPGGELGGDVVEEPVADWSFVTDSFMDLETDGPELLLEPTGFPPAKTYQKALFEAGIPLTSFGVADVQAVYERLKKRGVVFRTPPTKMGPVTVAVFEDTCGNLIQIAQK